jgi:RNA polymerase primary sigma factor
MRQVMEDYRSVDERLVAELGRNPTLEEIAEELHMTVDEAGSLSQMVNAARRLAQLRPEEQPEEEEQEQAEAQQAVENTAYFQTRQRIAEMLAGLSEEEAKLLSLRFGLEGGLPMTPEEAGRKLGLTPEEVVSREAAALAKLRQG